jgi:hypothetical protein
MSMGFTTAGVAAAAAVAGAGASIYSASQSGGSAPAPVPPNPAKYLEKYLNGLDKGLPRLAEMEGQYRPQFGQLNIADQQQYLNALLEMGGTATGSSQQQINAARSGEFASMAGNAGNVMNILGGIDPQGRQLAQQAGQMGISAMNSAQGLNMQEMRMSDQTARESFGARGRLNDNASVASEILGRSEVLDDKKRRAMGMAQNAMGMTQGFSNPALSILMGTPASLSLGRDYVASAAGIIGQNQPQFINPDAGINMGMQNTANLNSYMQAQAASSQNQASIYGQIGSSLFDLAGTLYDQ